MAKSAQIHPSNLIAGAAQDRLNLGWLLTILQRMAGKSLELGYRSAETLQQAMVARLDLATQDDWETVRAVCGYSADDFSAARAPLPLAASAIRHFCRNHRDGNPNLVSEFNQAATALPEKLAALYALYSAQARLDAEAAFFLAQTSGSARVAGVMADLLAIGGFNHADMALSSSGQVYAIAAAFDTSAIIDAASREAMERLALPPDQTDHLLQILPEEVSLLAAQCADRLRLTPHAFVDKARLLAEARQDVNRFPATERFARALFEGDLPISEAWVTRLVTAMRRIVPALAGRDGTVADTFTRVRA